MSRREPGESELTFMKVQRQLYRLRDRKYPKAPKSDKEIRKKMKTPEIAAEFGRTMNKKTALYAGSVVKKMFAFHVFASFAVINMIKDKIKSCDRKYLIDGTFKIVPRQFSQLLIVSIEYKNNVCPHIFVSLLRSRNTDD